MEKRGKHKRQTGIPRIIGSAVNIGGFRGAAVFAEELKNFDNLERR